MNYKRILSAALCLCMTAPMAASVPYSNTSALTLANQDVQKFTDSFVYTIHGDYIEINAVMSNVEGAVEVPAEIEGIPVTVIGEHGIAGNSKITSITLPDSIEIISKQAFSYDTALESINIPENVTEIPDEAFMNCMSLSSITLPENLKSIGVRAFYSCQKLTEIKLPESLEVISEMAFANCQVLTGIKIPSGITRLESAVFGNCNAIEKITVPENVTFIAKDALPTHIKNLEIHNHKCELEDGLYMFITKDCVITAAPGSTGYEFAESYGLEFESLYPSGGLLTRGDVNDDGFFGVADLVMMQNYLLGSDGLILWENGDMDGDGVLDVFDFIVMRKEIFNSPEFNPPVMNPDPTLDYSAKNLTADLSADFVTGAEADDSFILGQTEFAFDLFKSELRENSNTLVSPYSAMQALAMTANGAEGNTRSEMENVLRMDINNLNKYLYTQRISQHNDEKSKLSTANSIWARNDVNVNSNFLQTNVNYYQADFFKAPFDDTTVTDINNWVNDNTDEMIPEIIDELPEDAAMCLINAIAFDAKWETEFDKDMTVKADFTAIGNKTKKVDTMQSYDGAYYLEDENAKGIYKYYADRKYAFVAMLPNENISVNDYIAGLTAESFSRLLENPTKTTAGMEMPKFSYDFDTLLNNTLISMGMPTAFDEDNADFSGMMDKDNYISKVIQKTHIDIDEAGTKAAAATIVISNDSTVALVKEKVKFNRPFFYCIIDTDTNIPVFMGTLMDIPE